ncbi:peptidoglycan recognition protein-like [Musca vetustissima]|uniref:peptidoglycan recognition protein-like n=1 Tax=Musca vetustissima TaxID=27455 RepID=UPI002AB686DE|nr:peptidoglycan recognition protein-like [Musca vetustissima]
MTSYSSQETLALSLENTKKWLLNDHSDTESFIDSVDESSVCESATTEDDDGNYRNVSELLASENITNLERIFSQLPSPSFGDISINNSSNVVVGNIVKIKGDLIVKLDHNSDYQKRENITKQNSDTENKNIILKSVTNDTTNTSDLIITRNCWSTIEPAEEHLYLEEPTEFVIICHTASNSSNDKLTNINIIQSIQAYHIGLEYGDIGYNFLIGCDGNVYEGRGWGIVGAHTYRHNKKSIGIAFIGNFMLKLPTEKALEACKKLLQIGVDGGHLAKDFKLMGHKQCICSESPGKKLFDEIKTWEHFYDISN